MCFFLVLMFWLGGDVRECMKKIRFVILMSFILGLDILFVSDSSPSVTFRSLVSVLMIVFLIEVRCVWCLKWFR